jgi:hypothetical protein
MLQLLNSRIHRYTLLKNVRELAGYKRPAVQALGVTRSQEREFKDNFFKAMVTSCIAFNFVENEYLRKAFASLGMTAMSRQEVSGKRLKALTQRDQQDMRSQIDSMDYPAGSSDGWRKKYCEGGAGLMNFTVMGNTGNVSVDETKGCCSLDFC